MENGLDIVSYKIGKEHGGVQPTGEIDITQNGITNVSGYATANVQVPEKQLEEKSVTISSNTTTLIEPSTGKDGMSSVSVTTNIPQPSGKITITQNDTDIDVSSYASADVSVPAGADLSEYFYLTPLTSGSFRFLFKNFPPIDFSNLTNLNNAFSYMYGFVNIDLSSCAFSSNTNNVEELFSSCSNVEEINLSSLSTTANNTNCNGMFGGCSKLKKIDLSNFNPGSIQNGNKMFTGCTSLEELDISSMNMNVSSYTYMFNGVPANCLILVKDQTAKDWFTTNWSNLTNVQIKSEYIANQGA